MKKIEVYEAFDGTRFDSAAECVNYENPIIYIREELDLCITLKDTDGNKIELPGANDFNYDEKFEEAVNQADTCRIRNDLSQKGIDYLNEMIGISLPIKKGLYRWEGFDWISYKEDINEFLTNWHITFEELVNMGY